MKNLGTLEMATSDKSSGRREHTYENQSEFRKLRPLLMWVSATFLYCYQFFLRSSPNVMEDILREEF